MRSRFPLLAVAALAAASLPGGAFAFEPDPNFRRRDLGHAPRCDADGYFTDSRGRRYHRDPKTGQVRKA